MGDRINFLHAFVHPLRDALLAHYPAFRRGFLATCRESLAEYGEHAAPAELVAAVEASTTLPPGFAGLAKPLVDQLTLEFFASEYHWEPGFRALWTFLDPCVNKWRYTGSDELVRDTGTADLRRLWDFLVHGRSLIADSPFTGIKADGGAIGFLDPDEQRTLRRLIEQNYGDHDGMRDRYWTTDEKRRYDEARMAADGGYLGLSNHNPRSQGLEYVLQVLARTQDSERELVSWIE